MSPASPSGIRLSVVVAAAHSLQGLEACLASLQGQVSNGVEVIAVYNYGEDVGHSLKRTFPFVILIALPPATTVPELRARGIQASTGEIVALLEDNVTVSPAWCRAVTEAYDVSHAIVGGPVERVGRHRAVDWAVYFYEYGKYMLPLAQGESETLAGNNVSYSRALLDDMQSEWRDGLFEAFLHEQLRAQGSTLYMAPQAVVYHTMRYGAGKVLKQCYHHGRHFAGRRTAAASLFARLGFAAGSVLLPLILPMRIAVRTLKKRRHIGALMRACPVLMLFMTSWACGEFVGYLFGEGESVKQWV